MSIPDEIFRQACQMLHGSALLARYVETFQPFPADPQYLLQNGLAATGGTVAHGKWIGVRSGLID
jgi:hypothetical protein